MMSGGRSNSLLPCYCRVDGGPSDNLPFTPVTSGGFSDRSEPAIPYQGLGRVYRPPLIPDRSGAKLLNIPHADYVSGPALQKVEQPLRR
jgi:hypothetical protein